MRNICSVRLRSDDVDERGRKGKSLTRPNTALDVIGMDIGYGNSTSLSGFKYTLLLVDRTTHNTWVYGLRDMQGAAIADAIWSFFIDAGSIPHRIQCDFDPRFLGSKVRCLLTSHRIRITASVTSQPSIPKRPRREPLENRL